MAELHRITRPDGVLLLTLHSTPQWNNAIHDMENGGEAIEPLRRELEENGILFIADDHFIGSTHPDFYHTTFHAPWYVFERWTQWFDLAAYVPLGSHSQDLMVMRRRDDATPVQRPIGHGRRADAAVEHASEPAAKPAADHVTALDALLATRRRPPTFRGRVKRRVLRRAFNRQERINDLLIQALRESGSDGGREQRMLRVGLYELGQRLSSESLELRQELQAALAAHPEPSDHLEGQDSASTARS